MNDPDHVTNQESPGGSGSFVSIVIATRDRPDVLRDCLRDLSRQDYPSDRFEVLVVDDDSTGDLRLVVHSFASEGDNPKIHYLHQQRRGPSSARNLGVRSSLGDLVAFVDDDVEVPADWLSKLVAASDRHPESECLAGRVTLRLEAKPPRTCGQESIGESEVDQGKIDRPAILDEVAAANMLVRRGAFDRIGGLLEDLPVYGEETEWLYRLVAKGGQVTYVADARLWHRRGPGDLRLGKMLRARYRRGRSWPRIAPYIKRDVSLAEGLWRILPALAHAVTHRCWVGIFDASYWLGYSREAMAILLTGRGDRFVRWLPPGSLHRLLQKLNKGAVSGRSGRDGQ